LLAETRADHASDAAPGFALGNLTTDAHLAALAIESGSELASTDNDFRRFAGLRLVNPLIEAVE
jgi:predicted nucleic acid-binding protein